MTSDKETRAPRKVSPEELHNAIGSLARVPRDPIPVPDDPPGIELWFCKKRGPDWCEACGGPCRDESAPLDDEPAPENPPTGVEQDARVDPVEYAIRLALEENENGVGGKASQTAIRSLLNSALRATENPRSSGVDPADVERLREVRNEHNHHAQNARDVGVPDRHREKRVAAFDRILSTLSSPKEPDRG